jgi:hypothetical protein
MSIFSYFFKKKVSCYCIQANNKSEKRLTVKLWDSANSVAAGKEGNYGNDAEIELSTFDCQYSYGQLLHLTFARTVKIFKIIIEGSTISTVANNPITIHTYSRYGGAKTSSCWIPSIDKYQQQNNVREMASKRNSSFPEFELNALTLFSQQVNGSQCIFYRFYFKEKNSEFVIDIKEIVKKLRERRKHRIF